MSYILCDINGKETRIAVSEDLQSFSDPKIFKTETNFKKGIESIVRTVADLTLDEIRGMVVGFPGVLNGNKTCVVHSDEEGMVKWIEEPLVDELKKKLKAKVWLENSTALAGLGEAVHGAGDGYDIVAYHTIGETVEGAKIECGVIDSVAHSFEPGLQILDIDQTILGEGAEPTLENLVSAKALFSRTGEQPKDIPQEDAVWSQIEEYLAYGLRNTITYWSPDAIVLGGSLVSEKPSIRIDSVITYLHEIAGEIPVPDIVDVDLADAAVLYGALTLLNQKV